MSKTLLCMGAVAALSASPGVFPLEELLVGGGAASPTCSRCGGETYGTALAWAGTPAEAARRARAEEKLVFVLHVSGHFEDARFT